MRLVDCWEEVVKEQMAQEQNLTKVTGSRVFGTTFFFLLPAVIYVSTHAS